MKEIERPLYDDLLFKESFTDPRNRRILEDFLETMLGREKGSLHEKLQVDYESPIRKLNYSDKQMRGDILIYFEQYMINLECFTKFDKERYDKASCYAYRLASSVKRSERYISSLNIIQMVIVKKMNIKFSKELINQYKTVNIEQIEDVFHYGKLEFRYYPLDRLDNVQAYNYNEDRRVKWLRFIGAKSQEEREKIAKGDEVFMEFNEKLGIYMMDEASKELFNEWERLIREHDVIRSERQAKRAVKKQKEAEELARVAVENAKLAQEKAKLVQEEAKAVKEEAKTIQEEAKAALKRVEEVEIDVTKKVAKNLLLQGADLSLIETTTGLSKEVLKQIALEAGKI